MKKLHFRLRAFFLFGLFGLMFIGFLAISHEEVHVQIYKMYGIESHVEYFKYFPTIATVPNRPITTEDCPDVCELAHNLNEVIGYPLMIIAMMIIMGIFYILLVLEKTNKYFERLFEENERNE